jgi:NADPH2:quinone reductase
MRALVCHQYGSFDKLVIEDVDDPVCADNQLIVDIAAAGINFADILTIAGKYQVKSQPPFIPGKEAAGVVSALGSGITQFKLGDRVMVWPRAGTFAEKCVVDEQAVFPLPEGLNFDQGAGFQIAYGTTYHSFRQVANLKHGETVLVLGAAGGVGVAAVEIASAMGARVIAAASSDEKLEFARSVGANETINYLNCSLPDAVKEITKGDGADVVFDPVGGELALQALRATALQGRFFLICFSCGDIHKITAKIMFLKEKIHSGVFWGGWATRFPAKHVENVREMQELIKQGRLQPRTTESHPLDNYRTAFKAITQRRARGKIVLRMT